MTAGESAWLDHRAGHGRSQAWQGRDGGVRHVGWLLAAGGARHIVGDAGIRCMTGRSLLVASCRPPGPTRNGYILAWTIQDDWSCCMGER
jgi:hypothetical protein